MLSVLAGTSTAGLMRLLVMYGHCNVDGFVGLKWEVKGKEEVDR